MDFQISLPLDKGTQLKALEHARFNVRDIDSQVHDSLGIRVQVSNAKSHEERGKVERKIRTLREMLEKLGVDATHPMTTIQWESIFSRIASSKDNLIRSRKPWV